MAEELTNAGVLGITRMTRASSRLASSFRQRHAGSDGNEQMLFREMIANFRERAADLMRLHGKNQDAGELWRRRD